jgi:hypothetical protein
MNRDQDEFAKKITTYLDVGTAGLKAGTAYKLQQARARAVAAIGQPERATQAQWRPGFANMGSSGQGSGTRRGAWIGFGLGLLLLAAGYFGYQQWQLVQQTREIEELDVQILSSELPIDAYLDRGFQTWLTRYQP